VRSPLQGGFKIYLFLLRRAVPHDRSQSVLTCVAFKPSRSFDACSAQHNYGRDFALHFFEREGFSMNPPRKWTTRFNMPIGEAASLPASSIGTFIGLHGQNWVQGGLVPNKISGGGTNFWLLLDVVPGPNKQRALKPSTLLSRILRQNNQPGRLVRSRYSFRKFIFCDSRCPFGQIDNLKPMLGWFRSHFQKMC
jgi:hypothetical protein